MPASDEQEGTAGPLEQTPAPIDRSHQTRAMSPLVYELFVLGELMVEPMYSALLHEIAQRILGPLRPLSWGILSPLIRRLEQEGLTTSAVERSRKGLPRPARGQPRRIYSIAPAGRERFFTLMLTPSEYSRDTPEVFVIKLTKFQLLTPVQRLTVLRWYRGYVSYLRTYYQTRSNYVLHNLEITDGERSWIMQSVDYRFQLLNAELVWLDGQIALCSGEQSRKNP
jgi:DNA-binding PadR family transcriptional regulator